MTGAVRGFRVLWLGTPQSTPESNVGEIVSNRLAHNSEGIFFAMRGGVAMERRGGQVL